MAMRVLRVLPVVVLEDRRLVENDGTVEGGVESFDHLVVGDCDGVGVFVGLLLVAAVVNPAADVGCFPDGLLCDGERSDDKRPLAGQPRPFDLHAGLAEAGVGEDGRAAFADAPPDEVTLEWE
jgi:hypothetical protein